MNPIYELISRPEVFTFIIIYMINRLTAYILPTIASEEFIRSYYKNTTYRYVFYVCIYVCTVTYFYYTEQKTLNQTPEPSSQMSQSFREMNKLPLEQKLVEDNFDTVSLNSQRSKGAVSLPESVASASQFSTMSDVDGASLQSHLSASSVRSTQRE